MHDITGFEITKLLLKISIELAIATGYESLIAAVFIFETVLRDHSKVEVIYKYINKTFHNPISLEQIAS